MPANTQAEKIIIFDTTLRDGEQSPGASMTKEEKLQIATTLENLNVDIIEAGFAIASEADFSAIQNIATKIKDSTICSLARAMEKDIQKAGDALKNANNSRIHTFIATSDIHLKYKLKMSKEQVLEHAINSIKFAKNLCSEVEFSCEDASRSDFDFLCKIIEQAINAGASTINIPDTVGYSIPKEFGNLIYRLKNNIPNADKAIFSIHCHNDLGLATANSLSAIQNGARQIECTINGLGERAGNCALEEVTMAIKTREDYFNFKTDIKTKHLVSASKLVSQITAFAVQPNKAIVGINSFAHESGIHQDGILKHRETYEVMKAEDVGWSTDNQIILGKHSGRHALMEKLKLFCISYDKNDFDEIFKRFKNLADKKHNIYEGDLVSLVSCNNDIVENKIQIEDIKIKSTHSIVEAEVSINENGKIKTHTSTAKGTVNAVFDSINHLLGFKGKLSVYSVNSITEGVEAQGIVNIRVEENGEVFNGTGSHTDILMASASAYINAILSQNSILENNKKETI